jgi:hypothetical protein
MTTTLTFSRIALLATLSISAISIASCLKADNSGGCHSQQTTPVFKVEGPDTGSVNQPVIKQVTLALYNSCGQFGGFSPSNATKDADVTVIAVYNGCTCTQNISKVTKPFTFTSATPGTFVIRFWGGDTTIISDTIVIK